MGIFKEEKKKIEPLQPQKLEKPLSISYEASSRTTIGRTIQIKGDIIADEEVYIEGKIEGKIESKKSIIIGSSGFVKADLQAPIIKISGKVIGNIYASTKLDVDSTAHIEGNITAAKLSISESAYFKGSVDMSLKGEKVSMKMQNESEEKIMKSK